MIVVLPRGSITKLISGTFVYQIKNPKKLISDLQKVGANIIVVQYLKQYGENGNIVVDNLPYLKDICKEGIIPIVGLYHRLGWWKDISTLTTTWLNKQKEAVDIILSACQNVYAIYIPEEAWLGNFSPKLLEYYKKIAKYIKAKGLKVMLSPYFVRDQSVVEAVESIKQICKEVKPDIIAIQDGIGARKIPLSISARYISELAKACKSFGVEVWLDMEIADFKTKRPFDVTKVLASLSELGPYVDKIITFSYEYWKNNIPVIKKIEPPPPPPAISLPNVSLEHPVLAKQPDTSKKWEPELALIPMGLVVLYLTSK